MIPYKTLDEHRTYLHGELRYYPRKSSCSIESMKRKLEE